MKSKQCTLCKEIKLVSEFTSNKHSRDGLTHRCKKCIATKQREHRAKDPENTYRRQNREWNVAHKEQKQIYDKKHKQENAEYYCMKVKQRTKSLRDQINEIKSIPCMDCGIQYPFWIMDFDHRPGVKKISTIKDMVSRNRPLQIIIDEIKKCDIVCSNCHRNRTYVRKHPNIKLEQEREQREQEHKFEGEF